MAASSIPSTTAEEFRSFLAADWTQWLAEYPELATIVGSTEHNDRWTDESPDGIASRRTHLLSTRQRLEEFDRSALSDADRTSLELYRALADSAVRGLELGFDPMPFPFGSPSHLGMPLNQLEGIHVLAGDLLDLQPRESRTDLESIVGRLRALPAAVEQTLGLLRTGRANGFSPPRVSVRTVPEQIQALVPDEMEKSALLRPLRLGGHGAEAADRQRLEDEAHRVYRASIVPAFQRLHDFVVSDYLPACREPVSAAALPRGAERYEHLVAFHTTTRASAREIHEIGKAEVARLRTEMDALQRAAGIPGEFRDFQRFLRTDPRFFFSNAEELLEGYRTLARKVEPQLPRLFGRLPRLPFEIRPVPEFRARAAPAAYYMAGSAAAVRPGYFYVNTYDLAARPRWEMEPLFLHEAVPGHHLQIAIGQEISDLPAFRRESGSTAFVEGWALYAESLGEELGLYQDPFARFGRLNADIWRSVRLVVDTGLHAFDWSRDQAIAYFRENTGIAEHDIAVEVDRYIVWPGQALAYKMGALKIRELRHATEERLGDRFDLRAFHDAVLEAASLPLHLLESRIQAWAERCAAGAGAPAHRPEAPSSRR